MKYPTVTSDVSGFLVQPDDGYTPAGPYEPNTTYLLVPVPEGERVVVIVTEGGEWPEIKCLFCQGSGVVPEQHDYATEYLGCPDCQGTGVIGKEFSDNLLDALSAGTERSE